MIQHPYMYSAVDIDDIESLLLLWHGQCSWCRSWRSITIAFSRTSREYV